MCISFNHAREKSPSLVSIFELRISIIVFFPEKMSLEQLLTLEGVGRISRFLETCPGRDKVMRTLQYASKLVAHVYQQQTGLGPKDSRLILKLELLAKTLGDGRRLFRVGKYIGTALAVQRGVTSIQHGLQKSSAIPHLTIHNVVLRNLALTLYYLLDQYVWLARLKLIEGAKLDAYSLYAMRFWSISSAISLFCDLYVFHFHPPKTAEGLESLKLKIVKNICDMPLAFTSSFPKYASSVSPTLTNASGLVSSVAGLILAWHDVK